MCERLAGARGLPAPTVAGRPQRRQRHRAVFSAGYERDTNGIRVCRRWDTTGYEQDTNHGGTAQWLDRLAAAADEAVSECQTWPHRRGNAKNFPTP